LVREVSRMKMRKASRTFVQDDLLRRGRQLETSARRKLNWSIQNRSSGNVAGASCGIDTPPDQRRDDRMGGSKEVRHLAEESDEIRHKVVVRAIRRNRESSNSNWTERIGRGRLKVNREGIWW
jgi:hypothetical protein